MSNEERLKLNDTKVIAGQDINKTECPCCFQPQLRSVVRYISDDINVFAVCRSCDSSTSFKDVSANYGSYRDAVAMCFTEWTNGIIKAEG